MNLLAILFLSAAFYVAGCSGDDDLGTGGSGGAAGSVAAGGGGSDGGRGGAEAGHAGEGGFPDANVDRSEDASTDVTSSEPDSDEGEPASDVMFEGAPSDSELERASLPDSDGASSSPRVCAELCATDDDCARDSGVQKVRCHPTTHRCATCTDDMICIASRSLWTAKTCTVDGDCINDGGFSPFGDVCIDVVGTGYCAFLATSTTNCTSILNTPSFSTFTVTKYGSSDRVDVCGKPSRCDADRGSCQNPCTSNTSCSPARGGKTCNTGLGRCECASDADCGPGAPSCNLTLKQCECGAPTDCAADTGRTLTCP
jgi:hypothetical protein